MSDVRDVLPVIRERIERYRDGEGRAGKLDGEYDMVLEAIPSRIEI